LISEALEWAAVVADGIGIVVMLLGFIFAVVRFVPTLWQSTGSTTIMQIQEIRCGLGTYIVFALELMIISDLLHSVTSQRLEDLYLLGAIVVIRTAIGYFLGLEIQELAENRRQQAAA